MTVLRMRQSLHKKKEWNRCIELQTISMREVISAYMPAFGGAYTKLTSGSTVAEHSFFLGGGGGRYLE